MATTIVWFRRNLRLCDNHALIAASETRGPVVPVFIADQQEWRGASRWWLHHSLEKLGESLRQLGTPLVIRAGEPGRVIRHLVEETGATQVCYSQRYEPAARAEEREVQKLASSKLQISAFDDQRLHPFSTVLSKSGSPYKVFTAFWKASHSLGEPDTPLPAPTSLEPFPQGLDSLSLDDLKLLPRKPDWASGLRATWSPGESTGLETVARAATIAGDYAIGRDYPGKNATTRLSPHLHFGEVSPRQVWHAIRAATNSETLLRQLYWREFSTYLLSFHPTLAEKPMRREFEGFPWVADAEGLVAWQRGLTGYPIIDAGMRQLWHTGWMHNRVRMIAASFLVKDLLVPWQQGAAWFMDTLVDADMANNSASWQWVAGCGADAAPYFRIFNPSTQSRKFDKDGSYIRCWLPELAGLPNELIHEPWKADIATQRAARVVIGENYPLPIVDHGEARQLALSAYQLTRDLLKSRAGMSP